MKPNPDRSKNISLGEIARLIGGQLILVLGGEEDIHISGVASIEEATPGFIVLGINEKYLKAAFLSQASAVIVGQEVVEGPKPLIRTGNPRLAFAKALELFAPQVRIKPGIHPTAILGEGINLGKDVSIGAYVTIGDRVSIGDGVVIYPQTYIADEVAIGTKSIIYPRVTLGQRVKIGQRVIIHSGTVIGSDGFGYVECEGKHQKIPQNGGVVIEDEVEIGACVTIDRATTGNTIIGQGTKIDNLVQIAHNVKIGKNCLLVAQVGIAGSVKIGDNVVFAGQSGAVDHVVVKDRTVVAGRAVVTKDVGPNLMVSGFPARDHSEELKSQALIRRLNSLLKRVDKLERQIIQII